MNNLYCTAENILQEISVVDLDLSSLVILTRLINRININNCTHVWHQTRIQRLHQQTSSTQYASISNPSSQSQIRQHLSFQQHIPIYHVVGGKTQEVTTLLDIEVASFRVDGLLV